MFNSNKPSNKIHQYVIQMTFYKNFLEEGSILFKKNLNHKKKFE
jgi:hypothetical protein